YGALNARVLASLRPTTDFTFSRRLADMEIASLTLGRVLECPKSALTALH
ncbi:unnamed protein product, partial [marine sediment metagenome]